MIRRVSYLVLGYRRHRLVTLINLKTSETVIGVGQEGQGYLCSCFYPPSLSAFTIPLCDYLVCPHTLRLPAAPA